METIRHQNKRTVGKTIDTIMINKNCISCNQSLIWDNSIGGSFSKCSECDIAQWKYDGYAYRTIGTSYRIEWKWKDIRFKTIVYGAQMVNGLALNGAKLFDVRTEQQLEKLLILI